MTAYYQRIGCDRGPFGFFSGPPPAECGSIAQRIRQMEANYANLAAQASGSGNVELRRQQIIAAINQTCAPEAQGPRGFFESLFGAPRYPGPVAPGQPIIEDLPGDEPMGGRRLVCVRTCDGYAFPLSNAPGGREGADGMCQALCPGAETMAFGMPGGDNALERAASVHTGQPYVSLANAFKFKKSFDSTCTCKKDGESWSQILRRAESMLDPRPGDIIVTAQKAEELSRAKPPAPTARRNERRPAADNATEQAAESAASAPTAGQESAGIGPKAIETQRVVGRAEGPTQEAVTADGQKRAVRVIAPNVIPVPNRTPRP